MPSLSLLCLLLLSVDEATLRRAQLAQPNQFAANLNLGQYLLEAGEAKQAVTFLQSAVRLQPDDAAARHDLASAFIETERLNEAKFLLDKLPASAARMHLEAQWLAASGQAIPAAQLFQKAAEADPSEKHVFDWGNHLLTQGASEPALKIFRYGVEHFPQSSRLLVAQAVALYARGEYDEAVRSVCAGVDLNPGDSRPIVFLGLMIDLSPESAVQVRKRLEGFAKRFPNHVQAQLYYGLSLTRSETPQAAEPILRRALKFDPKLPQAHLELGRLYADQGRKAEAISELEAALRLSPDLEAAHYRLGQLYQKGGHTVLANQHFAKYRELKAKKR